MTTRHGRNNGGSSEWHSLIPRTLLLFMVILAFSSTLVAQRSGVLIAVQVRKSEEAQEFRDIKEPQYKTLWIAADANGKYAALATIPEIIVPRRDGFWHVGVKQLCEFSADPAGGGNEELRQVVWAAPVSKAAVIEQRPECLPDEPSKESETASAGSDRNQQSISQCGYTVANIGYLGPELISVSNYRSQSESCEPRGGRYALTFHVRQFESDTALSFGQLFGPLAAQAYARSLPKKAKDDTGEECGEPSTDKDDEWYLARREGSYTAVATQSLGPFGCSTEGTVRFTLPGKLTGEVSVETNWKLFKTRDKDLLFVFVSPAKDIAVVETKTEIKVYEFKENGPGLQLLSFPFSYPASGILAAQWATGSHIQDWTTQLQQLANSTLPAPKVSIKPTDQ